MEKNNANAHIAYRCPRCATATFGFVGKFALSANLLRLRCTCDTPSLDIEITRDEKIRLSVPCLYCNQNHNFTLSKDIFFGRDLFTLQCPYSSMDIAFIGDKEMIDSALSESELQIRAMLDAMELEDITELQPVDLDSADILPDATSYDTIRFLLKDLEADGRVKCPCGDGEYELRFNERGIEAYCKRCGAIYPFNLDRASAAEDFLGLDSITLT